MLKQGLFIDDAGEEHSIHIVEEQQFYRLDITRVGANFHTDIDEIEYSIVRKRNNYQYGDPRVYEKYKKFLDRVHEIHADSTKTQVWENGAFVQKVTKERSDLAFVQETKKVNGIYNSDTMILGEESLTMFVTGEVYGVKLEPINFIEYEEIFVGKEIASDSKAPYVSLQALKAKYNIKHIDDKDCVVADTIEVAKERLYKWMRSPAWIKAVDTETTGTDVDMYGEDVLVGVILSYSTEESTYFPFRHKEINNLGDEFFAEMMKVIILEQDKCVAHNKKFDRKVFLKEGYDVRIKYDTMLLSFIINPVIEKGAHALKELMFKLNGKTFLELIYIFTSSKLIDFSVLPKDIVKYYACPDGYNTIELFNYLYAKLPVYQRSLFLKECELADLKADQEFYGMRVDQKKFADSFENTNYVIDMLLKTFRQMTRIDGNVNSPAVLSDLIYNKMRCKVLLRTKTGKASTSGAAIKKLASTKAEKANVITENLTDLYGAVVVKAADLAKSKYPELVILEKYREYNKRKTAFYARFERTMKTGRIFFWINQNGAASGRQSSPMHQLPPELKAVMLSDFEDSALWGPDFSQIELRMIAFLAGETELIELCKDPENDIHRVIGKLISGKEMWEISKEERGSGKRRNFGVVYLISEFGLAGQIFGPGYTDEQRMWCKDQLDAFYKRFKRIAKFIRENGLFVQEKGYMMTKIYNRKRLFKEIFDPDISSRRKASLIRQANNMPVQGTAADYLKLAEVNMYNYIRNKGWYEKKNGIPMVRPMLSIHDEILISADNSIPKEEIIKMIKICMEVPIEGAPPFFVAPAKMDNWEGHSDDSLAIPIKYRDTLIDNYDASGKSVFKASYYDLEVSKELSEEMEADAEKSLLDLAKKYYDKVSFTYTHGDFGNVISKQAKIHGLFDYLESGFKKCCDENYKTLLDDYRDAQIKNYMNELIAEYGTDYKVVCEHVRHPSLTHALIDRYSTEMKGKDFTHLESIEYATKLFIEGIPKTYVFEVDLRKESSQEKFFDEVENLVNFDDQGNVVYDDTELAEDEDAFSDYDDEAYITYRSEGLDYRVWEIADAITVDVSNLAKDKIDIVLRQLWKNKDADGFFKVYLLFGGELIDTNFKIEELDYNEITDLIKDLEGTTVNA